jgi:hypothetical protein
MNDTLGRTFIFEKDLWERLDDDARRCLRSSTKQMEAILKTYFRLADVDLNKAGVEMLGELAPRSATKIPFIETEAAQRRRKKIG